MALESGHFSKKEGVKSLDKIGGYKESEDKVKEDTNVVDPKKDDIKFQINEMTFLVKLANMILTLP